MDRQGFVDFNTRLSPENSGKADSYARALRILDEVLPYQSVIDLHGLSLFNVQNTETIEAVIRVVSEEVKKMKRNEPNIFDYGKANQRSYPLKNFCSSALRSLKQYAQYEQEILVADEIVAQERNPRTISTKLIAHFNVTKEGEDKISMTKQRKGQDYFRRMILANYGGRCALTGIDIPQLLLASHIIPWSDKSHKQDRLIDKGLITISPDDYTVTLSSALRENESKEYFDKHFGIMIGKKLALPTDYLPNRDFLAYHRDKVFMGY